jgi:hypothetical protein
VVVVFSLYVLPFYRRWFVRYVTWSLLLAGEWWVGVGDEGLAVRTHARYDAR